MCHPPYFGIVLVRFKMLIYTLAFLFIHEPTHSMTQTHNADCDLFLCLTARDQHSSQKDDVLKKQNRSCVTITCSFYSEEIHIYCFYVESLQHISSCTAQFLLVLAFVVAHKISIQQKEKEESKYHSFQLRLLLICKYIICYLYMCIYYFGDYSALPKYRIIKEPLFTHGDQVKFNSAFGNIRAHQHRTP